MLLDADAVDQIFSRFDIDSNHTIDVRELHTALNELGLQTNTQEAAAVLQRFDSNRDGVIQLDEFRSLCQELAAFQASVATSPPPGAVANVLLDADAVDQIFSRFDIDSNHTIDVRELHTALNELGLQTNTQEAAAVLQRFDSNRDGVIQLDEFRSLCQELAAFQASTYTQSNAATRSPYVWSTGPFPGEPFAPFTSQQQYDAWTGAFQTIEPAYCIETGKLIPQAILDVICWQIPIESWEASLVISRVASSPPPSPPFQEVEPAGSSIDEPGMRENKREFERAKMRRARWTPIALVAYAGGVYLISHMLSVREAAWIGGAAYATALLALYAVEVAMEHPVELPILRCSCCRKKKKPAPDVVLQITRIFSEKASSSSSEVPGGFQLFAVDQTGKGEKGAPEAERLLSGETDMLHPQARDRRERPVQVEIRCKVGAKVLVRDRDPMREGTLVLDEDVTGEHTRVTHGIFEAKEEPRVQHHTVYCEEQRKPHDLGGFLRWVEDKQ